jgi:hypothetical protein
MGVGTGAEVGVGVGVGAGKEVNKGLPIVRRQELCYKRIRR